MAASARDRLAAPSGRCVAGHYCREAAKSEAPAPPNNTAIINDVTGANGPPDFVAETGGVVHRFREFVVFQPDQIIVEYLVAYQRKRTLCNCGLPFLERTVINGQNRGRKCAFCPKDQGDETNCGFIAVYPQCACGRNAQIKFAKTSGKRYYSCGKTRGDWCDWFGGWVPDEVGDGGGGASFGSPGKRPRYS